MYHLCVDIVVIYATVRQGKSRILAQGNVSGMGVPAAPGTAARPPLRLIPATSHRNRRIIQGPRLLNSVAFFPEE